MVQNCCLPIDAKNHPSFRATFYKERICFFFFSKLITVLSSIFGGEETNVNIKRLYDEIQSIADQRK